MWFSVGPIALLVVAAEVATIRMYLRFSTYSTRAWRVALLVSSSPISLYWTALTGYNNALVCFVVVAAILLVCGSHDRQGGAALGIGMLFIKVLTLWGVFALLNRSVKRSTRVLQPLLLTGVVLLTMSIKWDALAGTFVSLNEVTTGGLPHLLHLPTSLAKAEVALLALGAFLLSHPVSSRRESKPRRPIRGVGGYRAVAAHAERAPGEAYQVAFFAPLVHVLDRPGLTRHERWWRVMAPVVVMATVSPAIQIYAYRSPSSACSRLADTISVLTYAWLLSPVWTARTFPTERPPRSTDCQTSVRRRLPDERYQLIVGILMTVPSTETA